MALVDRKWVHAQLFLAWRVIVHYGRKLWPFGPRYGLERFVANYVPEGLPWATEESRALAHEPGRCTLCGACDDACPLLRGLPRAFLGPMTMVSSAARAAPHFEDAADTFRTMTEPDCEACRACEAACPEDIPILRLAAGFLAQLHIIEEARRGGDHPPLLPASLSERS